MDDGTDNKSGSYVEGSCRCFRSAPANCSAVDMEEEKGEFKTGNRRSNYLCRVCTGIRGNPKTDLFYIRYRFNGICVDTCLGICADRVSHGRNL